MIEEIKNQLEKTNPIKIEQGTFDNLIGVNYIEATYENKTNINIVYKENKILAYVTGKNKYFSENITLDELESNLKEWCR